jgi:hypothetical protein
MVLGQRMAPTVETGRASFADVRRELPDLELLIDVAKVLAAIETTVNLYPTFMAAVEAFLERAALLARAFRRRQARTARKRSSRINSDTQ